jgi:SsrA-binding protein
MILPLKSRRLETTPMGIKIIATNKKAYHEYFIEETYEAGIVLTGTEVKSLRLGNVNIKESFCRIMKGELFINNMNISPYEQGNRENHDPTRIRKLLLHKAEIDKLIRKVEEKGLSLVPTKIYFKNSYVKLEVGVARGKKLHDKRESLKKKQADREIAKIFKENR